MDEPNYWLQQAKTGDDPTAFEKWMDLNASAIAAFAFQNGVPDNQNGRMQQEVFRRFYGRFTESDSLDADLTLYRIASEILPEFTEAYHKARTFDRFHFKEDEELHCALQHLPLADRIAFTLSNFHEKSMEELSAVLSVEPVNLHSILEASYQKIRTYLALEEHLLDKRLALIAKSYKRMELPGPDKEGPSDLPTESLQNEPPKTKPGKGVAVMLAAVLLIGMLFISSFLMDGQDSTNPADSEGTIEEIDETVEQWREEYEYIRNSSPELLGISSETYEELAYVNAADRFAEGILSDENIDRMRDNPQELEDQFTRLLFYIQTPLGMMDLVENHPLSAEETDLFIYTFAEKTQQLMEVSNRLLEEFDDEFEIAILDGERSADQLLANQANYSERPSILLSGMKEQMLMPFSHPTEERFISRRDLRPLYGISPIMNDWTITSNLMMLEKEPFFDDTGLLLNLDEAAYLLKEMEHYLLDENSRSMLYTGFLDKFQQLFWLVLKGSETQPVFGANGTVNEEYQTVWNTLAESRNNPILAVMLPILQEMEQTGWTDSKHYDELSQQQIVGVMNAERAGMLAEEMPNGHMLVEPEFIDISGYSFEETEELYEQFVLEYDLSLLSGKSPSDVYLLYHFANRQEDPEAMWHLLDDDGVKPEKEEFLDQWQQIPDIAEEARWLEFSEGSFYRSRENLLVQLTVNYSNEPELYREGPVLITGEEDAWLVKYQFSENYSTEQLGSEYKEQVLSLYDEKDWQNATPGEIFGVILLAKEQRDYETLEELMDEYFYQQENRNVQETIDSIGLPLLEDLTVLSFYTEIAEEGSQELMGSLRMSTADASMTNLFSMIKTEEGWKLIY